jgi:hypothetical protein
VQLAFFLEAISFYFRQHGLYTQAFGGSAASTTSLRRVYLYFFFLQLLNLGLFTGEEEVDSMDKLHGALEWFFGLISSHFLSLLLLASLREPME